MKRKKKVTEVTELYRIIKWLDLNSDPSHLKIVRPPITLTRVAFLCNIDDFFFFLFLLLTAIAVVVCVFFFF